eukprot:762440-Hanusia_phi.AAC.2
MLAAKKCNGRAFVQPSCIAPARLHAEYMPMLARISYCDKCLEGKVKCFSEDLPSNTLVTGDFAAESIPDGQNNMPIEIQVTDPYTKDNISFGKFAFTTASTGDYIVCFHNKGGLEFMTQRRVTLVLKHGIDARDYSQVMKEEHLSGVQV